MASIVEEGGERGSSDKKSCGWPWRRWGWAGGGVRSPSVRGESGGPTLVWPGLSPSGCTCAPRSSTPQQRCAYLPLTPSSAWPLFVGAGASAGGDAVAALPERPFGPLGEPGSGGTVPSPRSAELHRYGSVSDRLPWSDWEIRQEGGWGRERGRRRCPEGGIGCCTLQRMLLSSTACLPPCSLLCHSARESRQAPRPAPPPPPFLSRAGDSEAARRIGLAAGQRRLRQGKRRGAERGRACGGRAAASQRALCRPGAAGQATTRINCTRKMRACACCRLTPPSLSTRDRLLVPSQVYKAYRHGVQPVAVKILPVGGQDRGWRRDGRPSGSGRARPAPAAPHVWHQRPCGRSGTRGGSWAERAAHHTNVSPLDARRHMNATPSACAHPSPLLLSSLRRHAATARPRWTPAGRLRCCAPAATSTSCSLW